MEVLHATYEVEVSNNTVVDWYSMFREVCDLFVTKQFDNVQIGGPYLHVELDETHLTRRKYNRGRQSVMERAKYFTFGGVCIETGERFYVLIQKCDRNTIWPLIKKHIAPGTSLHTDGATIYEDIDGEKGEKFGLDIWNHDFVNHSAGEYSRLEMSPNSKKLKTVTTNHVENQWKHMKKDMTFRNDPDFLLSHMAKHQYFKQRLEGKPATLENWMGSFLFDVRQFWKL